jgi:hypothetical protein
VQGETRESDADRRSEDAIPNGERSQEFGDQGDYSASASLLLVGARGDVDGLSHSETVRVAGNVPIMQAQAVVEEMVRLDILWLIVGEIEDDEALATLFYAAAAHDAELICETNLACLDRIIRLVPASMAVQWLVDPDATERQVALAAARPVRRMAVYDPSRDAAMDRIDQLQDEVERIGRLLGKLAGDALPLQGLGHYEIQENSLSGGTNVHAPPRSFRPMSRLAVLEAESDDRVKAKRVRHLIRQRRAREQYFPAELFADPAWDMLLDLYAARLEGQVVSVSSLCIAAAVPATTALRWIKTLTDSGLFLREADARDGRRIFIAMSDRAFTGMERYFRSLVDA